MRPKLETIERWMRNGEYFPFDYIPSSTCEIIGNIHDNPELLEGGREQVSSPKCEHDKVYSNIVLTTYPEQYSWACKSCGELGRDYGRPSQGYRVNEEEYRRLVLAHKGK